jgi:hypothetical protein
VLLASTARRASILSDPKEPGDERSVAEHAASGEEVYPFIRESPR